MSPSLKLAALFAAALAAGAAGLNWDLPSDARAARVLAPRWDRAALFDRLAGGWEEIYRKAEGSSPLAAEAAGKYSTRLKGRFSTDFKAPLPEPELWNSYRSMLIRSRYPDETMALSDLARMKPARLQFRPPSFIYGGGYLYPLGAYYFSLSKLGAVEPLPLRAALERTDTLGGVYLAGRALSAVSFAAVCLLVFLITRRLEPGAAPYAAYAAALTLPALVIHARYLTPHLWAAAWSLGAVYYCLRALPDFGLRPLLAAGACLGLAAGSYWSAAHTGLFMLAILLSPGQAALKKETLKKFAAAAAAGAAVFLAVNPYLPFSLAEAAREFAPGAGQPGLPGQAGPWAMLAHVFPSTLGPAFALLLPAGCLWGLFSGRPLLRNLALAALLFALPASYTLQPDFSAGVRRFFPWLLLGEILAVLAVSRLTDGLRPAARAAAFAAALAPGLLSSAAYTLSFTDAAGPRSTFRRMADRLDAMPGQATLGLTEFPQPAYLPAFRLDRWRLRLADAKTLPGLPPEELPEYLLLTFDQKPALAGFLASEYALEQGYYPRALPGFNPDPYLCAAHPPLELYRRAGAGL
jgi:hypothetical protein